MPRLRIEKGTNPYSREVQGEANECICVAMTLDRARQELGLETKTELEDVFDRLEYNAPRIAVITGSPDHPAHVMDHETLLKAVISIWNRGGVPFVFGIPVVCDGTAQSNHGMCYSLQSRNLVSAMVVNQMEGHSYHGAFVIQGCDKTPFGVLNGLAALDVSRRMRNEAPVFATFAPAHVLRGGTIPNALRNELLAVADRAADMGFAEIGKDLRDTMFYILQCSSNQAFQGVFLRAVQAGIMTHEQHKDFEKRLAVSTCDRKGGVCAFNGTGNSCRHLTCALGFVHPGLAYLIEPPTFEQVDAAVEAMLSVCNDPTYSVSNIVIQNMENAVRVHSTMGGSTNLMMHLISAMIYAGKRFSIHEYDKIRRKTRIPDLFDYSLTEGRDIFALAQQCCDGRIAGIETVLYELKRNQVPIVDDAPTMAGMTWAQRLLQTKNLSAENVKVNPIILSQPRRKISGIDVLSGNIFESAVVKISGMSEEQLNKFDEKVAVVCYCESEEEAIQHLLNDHFLEDFKNESNLTKEMLLHLYQHNAGKRGQNLKLRKNRHFLYQLLVDEKILRIAFVIAGVGPEAYGMPEMFTPMQHINSNSVLREIASVISDGRYSGVSYGAAIGHVTPEAYNYGKIIYLATGDLLHLRLRKRRIDYLDTCEFHYGKIQVFKRNLENNRPHLACKRIKRMQERRLPIDPTNRMNHVTDAAHGVVPMEIWNQARR
ncbi:MAG: dihydroxy-acid dehydratase [Candidatus Omnitrophota bacterium]|nr:MAG: dihydroxy-acid dehydratase [Candidatus Omnitrophota bacterium]